MISDLIELFIKFYKTNYNSRARLIKEMKKLSDNLKKCHIAFLEFTEHPKYSIYIKNLGRQVLLEVMKHPKHSIYIKDIERKGLRSDELEEIRKLEEKHKKAIKSLSESLFKLDHVFEIFSPETSTHLHAYRIHELDFIPDVLITSKYRIATDKSTPNDFETAHKKLQDFLKQHYNPEDFFPK